MILPMGTIMTVCMIIGVVVAQRLPGISGRALAPGWLQKGVGGLLVLAGLWNAGWHALRHLDEFWGLMALVSGIAMLLVAALLLLPEARQPRPLVRSDPWIVAVLAVCAVVYGYTILTL